VFVSVSSSEAVHNMKTTKKTREKLEDSKKEGCRRDFGEPKSTLSSYIHYTNSLQLHLHVVTLFYSTAHSATHTKHYGTLKGIIMSSGGGDDPSDNNELLRGGQERRGGGGGQKNNNDNSPSYDAEVELVESEESLYLETVRKGYSRFGGALTRCELASGCSPLPYLVKEDTAWSRGRGPENYCDWEGGNNDEPEGYGLVWTVEVVLCSREDIERTIGTGGRHRRQTLRSRHGGARQRAVRPEAVRSVWHARPSRRRRRQNQTPHHTFEEKRRRRRESQAQAGERQPRKAALF
jgi:hypothetical protein